MEKGEAIVANKVRILVVGAHPQDPFERAGGTAAKHLERGDEVMFVTLTAGVVTHAFGVFPPTGEDKLKDVEKIKTMKREEFERASRSLGLTSWRFFDWPESPMLLGLAEYVALVNLIREFRPDVVLCAHPVEVGRQDHMDSGRFVVAAVDYARAEGFPSPLAPHTVANLFMFHYPDFRSDQLMGAPRHAPEVVVDISSVIGRKRAAREQFATTQAKPGEDHKWRMDRFQERVEGAVGYNHGFEYAEEFSRLNPERVQYLPLA
jgi:N-acetylglucosamine malate deacetylase 1